MNVVSGIVLFAVIWFMTFFVILPLRLKTQGEAGKVVPGTHSSAPAEANLWRKAKLTTICAVVLWAVIAGIIISGVISVRDFDIRGTMSQESGKE